MTGRLARFTLLGAALLCSWTAVAASGERAHLRLVYVAPDAVGCPDEGSFRNLAAARLGYDPFAPESADVVRVTLARDHRRLRGRAEVTRAGQPPASARELSGEPDQCEALAAALATTLAIALDPLRATSPAPPLPPSAQVSPPTVVLVERAPPPASPPPESQRPIPAATPPLRVSPFGVAGGIVSVASAPSITLGGEIGFGLRVRSFSIEIDGRAETTPAPVRVSSGDRLQATILSGAILPCGHVGRWVGCAFARIGAFQGYAPDVTHPSLGTSIDASLGARVAYAWPLTSVLALQPSIEGAMPLTRTSLLIDGTPVWTAPPVTASAAVSLVATFP